jgi:anaerobic dimethyl sulfoxide reductase subunit C (anchor subunit)
MMNIHDYALIAFTILAQMAVGSFVVLGFVHVYAARKTNMEEADRLSDRALLAIGPVLGLGLIASLFHLGSPLNAYRAVTNFGTSWLSREITFGVSFAVLGAVFAFLQWRKISTFAIRNVIAWIAALVGLAMLFSMSNIYLLPTQPAWNTLATPLTFFTTAFLLGALAMGVAFVANYAYLKRNQPDCADEQCTLLRDVMRWIAIVSVVLLGIELVTLPFYLASLAAGSAAAVETAQLIAGPFGWALILRLALVFLGAGVVALFLYQNALSPGQERMVGNLAYTAFALVLVAEVLGRFLFYATHVPIGI